MITVVSGYTLQGSGNLEAIQIKKLGADSYLEEGVVFRSFVSFILFILGFLLEKKIGVNQPKRIEDAKILIANTAMDTDKIKARTSTHTLCTYTFYT